MFRPTAFMAVGRNVTTGFFALPIICRARACSSRTDPADTKPGHYKGPRTSGRPWVSIKLDCGSVSRTAQPGRRYDEQ
jgi:hypothetical protein